MISDRTLERLKLHAEPLVDTVDTVVTRLIDFYEVHCENKPIISQEKLENANKNQNNYLDVDLISMAKENKIIDSELHPSLKFAKFRGAIVNGNKIEKRLGWNGFLLWTINYASKYLNSDQLSEAICINHVKGKKLIDGFKFLPNLNISVQGQNTPNAWKATRILLEKINVEAEVNFSFKNLDSIVNKFVIKR